jgi:hypothetical protein
VTDQALTLQPIGRIRTTSADKVDAPRQPAAATDVPGVIELFEGRNLEHAIEDLAGWERIWVIFWFDRNPGWRPKVLPPRSTTGRKGVLATRARSADPGAAWEVAFSAAAEAQLAWIAARSALALRERIGNTLKLGPQPHPYRRIRRDKDGGLTLAVQDWRAGFRVDGQNVEVLRLYSGYRQSQLQSGAEPGSALELHREFRTLFG